MTADDWAMRLASGDRIAERVAVVVAHADDETLFAGPLLGRLDDGVLIHVTDGAPVDMTDAHRLGFSTRQAYATTRATELDVAVAALGADVDRRAYAVPDQAATAAVAGIVDRLVDDLSGAAVVATHPYEGGHPDHDAVALAVAAAIGRIGTTGMTTPAHVEFASYHLLGEERVWAQFWPAPTSPERTRSFTPADAARVEAALAAHASQRTVFDDWRPRVERWRAAPRYDFARSPPPGACLYDRFGWTITSADWRAAAAHLLRV